MSKSRSDFSSDLAYVTWLATGYGQGTNAPESLNPFRESVVNNVVTTVTDVNVAQDLSAWYKANALEVPLTLDQRYDILTKGRELYAKSEEEWKLLGKLQLLDRKEREEQNALFAEYGEWMGAHGAGGSGAVLVGWMGKSRDEDLLPIQGW